MRDETMTLPCPELPWECKQRFINQYSLTEYQAEMMTKERWIANFFEETVWWIGLNRMCQCVN